MRIVRTRAFNHTGPRRGDVFAMSSFAKQLASVELGRVEPVLRVGNLDAIRDFTDVRDVARAYVLAATGGEPGEVYNIASGVGHSIRELLDTLIALSGIEVEVEIDPQRLRPSDVEILVGDSTRFRERTGWKPTIPLETTLSDLLDYWRRRLRTSR
jgi:GDP-4-dehydro-6-deoxy-D-mannose reductase